MPRLSQKCWSSNDKTSIASAPLLDFLVPLLWKPRPGGQTRGIHRRHRLVSRCPDNATQSECNFFSALAQASSCCRHQHIRCTGRWGGVHNSSFSTWTTSQTASKAIRADDFSESVEGLKRWHEDEGTTKLLDGQPDPGGSARQRSKRQQSTGLASDFFNTRMKDFAAGSNLPQGFFDDMQHFQFRIREIVHDQKISAHAREDDARSGSTGHLKPSVQKHDRDVKSRMNLLQSVRELEAKLAQAKQSLHRSTELEVQPHARKPITLSKDDYMNLVDLYYYTHKKRFTPEAPDYSPTPTFLEDYSFKLSEDFAPPSAYARYYEDEEGYESPLKEIESSLRMNQIREVAVMQDFVNLLLDDRSSNRALFKVYQKLPSPGVAYLPRGVRRLFLQRMSTPWIRNTVSMVRYLSLIDDMQRAELPITRAEWSSAIYLAGRTFSQMSNEDALPNALKMWRRMEMDADVKASNVTFNILFDIAVRAGKYVLADTMLREMHNRGLRLNRLGRVSLIYYHGLRQDGDAIRKTYRDFVDAGEIVDTLVLNCVIASLNNARENTAAEQTYERMKDIHLRRRQQKQSSDGTAYKRYPDPGSNIIDGDVASNSLGRTLLRASHLRSILPENHQQLQNAMPLTPDQDTFKSMISYHTNVSGDIDRITVLLNEMVEIFGLPFRTRTFQLLFKGFALHGHATDSTARWSAKQLDLVWDRCREAVKETRKARRAIKHEVHPLPNLAEAEANGPSATSSMQADFPKEQKLHEWYDFVLDLAAFPRERRKPIERIHAQLFDEEITVKDAGFSNPFFPAGRTFQPYTRETYYPLGDSATDHEEGEYTLPSPAHVIEPNYTESDNQPTHNGNEPESGHDEEEERGLMDHEVVATRPLVCWLLRAYARCYASRSKMEEIWNSVKKVYHPRDATEKESVIRVLRRCLRDCDRHGPHML